MVHPRDSISAGRAGQESNTRCDIFFLFPGETGKLFLLLLLILLQRIRHSRPLTQLSLALQTTTPDCRCRQPPPFLLVLAVSHPHSAHTQRTPRCRYPDGIPVADGSLLAPYGTCRRGPAPQSRRSEWREEGEKELSATWVRGPVAVRQEWKGARVVEGLEGVPEGKRVEEWQRARTKKTKQGRESNPHSSLAVGSARRPTTQSRGRHVARTARLTGHSLGARERLAAATKKRTASADQREQEEQEAFPAGASPSPTTPLP